MITLQRLDSVVEPSSEPRCTRWGLSSYTRVGVSSTNVMEVTFRQNLYGTHRGNYKGFLLNYTIGKFYRKGFNLKKEGLVGDNQHPNKRGVELVMRNMGSYIPKK